MKTEILSILSLFPQLLCFSHPVLLLHNQSVNYTYISITSQILFVKFPTSLNKIIVPEAKDHTVVSAYSEQSLTHKKPSKQIKQIKLHPQLGMVEYAFNLRAQETEAGWWVYIPGQPRQHSEILSQKIIPKNNAWLAPLPSLAPSRKPSEITIQSWSTHSQEPRRPDSG